MLNVALDYCGRGWNPVPIPHRSKRPMGNDWQLRRITAETAAQWFNGNHNVGVQLGAASGGLTDVDLDCAETIAIASYILPATKAIFGRKSKRNSHRLYVTSLSANTDAAAIQLKDPKTKGVLLELRIGGGDKGAQTVFPGSVHPDGEPIAWEENGEPATVDGNELEQKVRTVAACALMARYWPGEGGRHDAARVTGGFLARCGHHRTWVKVAAEAIAKAAGDPEWRDRRKAAEDAAMAYAAGKNTYGFNAMRDTFGLDIADRIAEWLDYRSGDENASPANVSPGNHSEPSKAEDRPPQPRPLIFTRMTDWESSTMPDREWAVYGRVPMLQTTLFSGEGAAGKSTTALHLCAAHALGRDWLGVMPEPGPAIFMDCEDDELEMRRRLTAVRNHYNTTFTAMIAGGLHLISMCGQDAVIAIARGGKIEPTPLYKSLLEAAGDIKPKMFVIASLANIYAGSEIDRSQVQQFIALTTKIAITAGGAVVLISHPSLTGINTGTGLSGSTQWHNSVRARFTMASIKPEPGEQPDSDLREIVFKKSQYSRVADTVVVRYQDGMFLPLPGASSLDKAAQEVKADEVFIELLRRFTREHRHTNAKSGPTYAPAIFAKEDEAKRARLTSKDLEAAMRRLFKAEQIHNEQYGKPSRPHFHLAVKG